VSEQEKEQEKETGVDEQGEAAEKREAIDQTSRPAHDAFSVSPRLFAIVASLIIVAATALLVTRSGRKRGHGDERPLTPTIADLQAIHAGVRAGGAEVRRLRRIGQGDAIETDAEGRARLRLDDGTAIVVDRDTRLTLTGAGVELARGRIFVQGVPGARAEVALGAVTALLSDADAAVERGREDPAAAKIYAPRAELTLRTPRGEQPLRSGETAVVRGDAVEVGPERGFDDWTFGMATPWGARGAPRRAVGELWGRPGADAEVGAPLTLRAHDVRATITGELSETEARTTFFNGGSQAVVGDFRMALPPGAIVSGFSSTRAGSTLDGQISLAARGQAALVLSSEMLEWAGEGWVRGTIPGIEPGDAVTVTVRYAEWLSPVRREGTDTLVVQYRYPLAADAAPPQIGEFSARIDASPSRPRSVGAGFGGASGAPGLGPVVELRRPDFRPTADLVVEVELPPFEAAARMYLAPPASGLTVSDDAGATILVRTELPAGNKPAAPAGADGADGVTLALLLDTSGSVEPALLDAERALAGAIVAGLGARDRVVVLAADQEARPVGPASVGPLDAARRAAITQALDALTPGGATDLGRALEASADALPADAPAAMVIYIGDGWPTVGDGSAEEIEARLSRRAGGPPRLGAVAVGPLANRAALSALTRGSGPLFEMADAADAPRVAVSLLAEALQPAAAGVELVLGPEVERIYPRSARAIPLGDTVTALGRVRGDPPREITLRWRDGRGAHEERRPLSAVPVANEADVRRRWAAARVEEIALRGKGREAATDVALRAGLLTPWTAWVTRGASESGGARTHVPTPLATRILDLASAPDTGGFAAVLATRGAQGTLLDTLDALHPGEGDGGDDGGDDTDAYKAAVAAAARRAIDQAAPAVRTCRDSRAALRPDISGDLAVSLEVTGEGRADDVAVRGQNGADDAALLRCVEVVVAGLAFPASGLREGVKVTVTVELPPPRAALRARRCSPTATLPLPLRRGVWRERLDRGAPSEVYLAAKQSCELPTWSDRRALLELILDHRPDGMARVTVARELDRAGEADAAALLRREAVRRAKSPEELRQLRFQLLHDESYPEKTFRKQYKAAQSDADRLAVVRRFLGLAPHDARLRRQLLRLLESLKMPQELAEEVRRLRRDPFAEASLLAEGAAALRRIGQEAEARRAFGELAERAPIDPWARAFLGDRLRNEGWYDEAAAAYATLEELAPGDPAAALRLSLAHAGAGRLDVAVRMLARVAQTGGRTGSAELGDLAGRLAQALIAEARGQAGLGKDDADRLVRAALELPFPGGDTVVLVRGSAGQAPLEAALVRGPKEAREERRAELSTPAIGLYSLRIDPDETSEVLLRLKRTAELLPAQPSRVRVDALVPHGKGVPVGIVSTEVDLPVDGKPVDLRWAEGHWVPAG